MKYAISLLALFSLVYNLCGQIKGVVLDSQNKTPLQYASVFYAKKGIGSMTNEYGEYTIEKRHDLKELTVSAIGYKTKKIAVTASTTVLNIELLPDNINIEEVVVKTTKRKYSRKNNPAVDFMRKVIANKDNKNLEQNDFYRYEKYRKITSSLNKISREILNKGFYKKIPDLENHLETSNQKDSLLLLNVSVQENTSEVIYRRNPKSTKTLVQGIKIKGVENLLLTGDLMGEIMEDVFADVNIYDNNIRLLQRRFVSPISDNAILFYRFFLKDTVMIGEKECIHLKFTPANSQDFGFSGDLYVLKDSTFAVKKCRMELPRITGVNFVENLELTQQYEPLPDGKLVLTSDEMIADLAPIKSMQGIRVERQTKYLNHSFDPIDDKHFASIENTTTDPEAHSRDELYWNKVRPIPLTTAEKNIETLVEKVEGIPSFNYVVFIAKMLFEGYIETNIKGNDSKFDIGPLFSMISYSHVEGLRLRFGGMTTAKLHPHWFGNFYVAYGFRDNKWKYNGRITYSFKKCERFPWEYLRHNISINYRYDLAAPTDNFLETERDNLLVAFKTTLIDQLSYLRETFMTYEIETPLGISFNTTARHREDQPTGRLHYIKNNPEKTEIFKITTSEITATLRYAPGEKFSATKIRRRPISLDAPVTTLTHTAGIPNLLGGEYTFNLTEATFWNRFWLGSWGKLDLMLQAGIQWNTVPFPFLIVSAANTSFIIRKESFNLLNNMEFLNDKYASLILTYDMNGKLFNRIPFIKMLKWREVFRVRVLHGTLTPENDPQKSDNPDLFLFPQRDQQYTSFAMNPNIPYIEVSAGIYNILKVLNVEYVRRLTYLNNPGIKRHGVRFMLQLTF